jgi:2-methylcitrate dehydratase PrpD
MSAKTATRRVAEFACDVSWEDLPADVRKQAIRCVLDLLGSTVAGSRTKVARLVANHALEAYGDGAALIIGRGVESTPVGAALANGFAANALDLDDGYRPVKGHLSAAVIPAVLSAAQHVGASGKEFLTAVVVGLEVAIRAGLVLHKLYGFYHGTGAWGPIGAAAGAAPLFGAGTKEVWHALGIAEFHAPMTPEMRSVDYPSMLKDGIGWGAMTGLASAQMAAQGFTGIPSLFDAQSTGSVLAESLGREYLMRDLYFKPYACCRWAQPAVKGTLIAAAKLSAKSADIARVRVHTFDAATRLRSVAPRTTEEAQFSLPWAVACALTSGTVGPDEVIGRSLEEPGRLALAARVEMIVDPEIEDLFPSQALARVEIETSDGCRAASEVVPAPGDPADPLSEDDLADKFRRLTTPVLDSGRAERLFSSIWELPGAANLNHLACLLYASEPS